VRLAEPAGEAARFSKSRPSPGSIMLMLSPTRRQARLGLWTGPGQEENAIVVDRAGRVAAIVRNGQALYPTAFAPVVEQLLAGGVVRRAQLGVQIMAVRGDDPQRMQVKELGARPAARVVDVLAGSVAAKAGIRAGDLILSLAGEAVEDIPTFAAALANKSGPTELLVLRDGQPRKIVVDLKVQ
jgi:S1-C subfamily serine protease